MNEKLFKLLMAIEKYLPQKLKQKIFDYLLKRSIKKGFPLMPKVEPLSFADCKSPFQPHLDELEKQMVISKETTKLLSSDPEIKRALEILKKSLD
jgi:hypothetical protein